MNMNYYKKGTCKFIVVCGATASGIGKGILVSSIAALFKAANYRVSCIKIDPYLNIDAGTMSPYEHGEVYVTFDGGEVDLDLGNYERFLDCHLTSYNSITSGKIYRRVMESERKGEYLGKTVQIVPHVTNAIMEWILEASVIPTTRGEPQPPEICLIELGGTVGDIESGVFLEAVRQLQSFLGHDNMSICLAAFVPIFGLSGEPKTKPSQHGFKEVRYAGLSADFVFERSERPLQDEIIAKLALFSGLPVEKVVNVPDLDSVYNVILHLNKHKVVEKMSEVLKLPIRSPDVSFWDKYYKMHLELKKNPVCVVKIAFVGKYVDFKDAYMSVYQSFNFASIETGVKIDFLNIEAENLEKSGDHVSEEDREKREAEYREAWDALKKADAIFVPGGFGYRGVHGKLAAIRYARENKIPFFGICYGFQLAVVEFCRNMLHLDAISEEYVNDVPKGSTAKKVIVYMPETKTDKMGGTMRLGDRTIMVENRDSWAYKIYGSDKIVERHRHRYEVLPELHQTLEKEGLSITGLDETRLRMEIAEIRDHPFFIATQFHPELSARVESPAPIFIAFVLAAAKKLDFNEDFTGGIVKKIKAGNPNRPHYQEEERKADEKLTVDKSAVVKMDTHAKEEKGREAAVKKGSQDGIGNVPTSEDSSHKGKEHTTN